MEKDVIIACDFNTKEEMNNFLLNFKEEKPFIKIGMELFYATGIEYVKELKAKGYKIFLDLKLHDIPNTVYKTIKVLAKLDVDILNVHASGGKKMMLAAKKAILESEKKTKLIAVTQLTSICENQLKEDLLINESLINCVKHYALNAKTCDLDGIVCSPNEVIDVNSVCDDFITITPGIRMEDDEKEDQVRITTPKRAKELGSTFIVVGRSIIKEKDPYKKYLKIKKEFLED